MDGLVAVKSRLADVNFLIGFVVPKDNEATAVTFRHIVGKGAFLQSDAQGVQYAPTRHRRIAPDRTQRMIRQSSRCRGVSMKTLPPKYCSRCCLPRRCSLGSRGGPVSQNGDVAARSAIGNLAATPRQSGCPPGRNRNPSHVQISIGASAHHHAAARRSRSTVSRPTASRGRRRPFRWRCRRTAPRRRWNKALLFRWSYSHWYCHYHSPTVRPAPLGKRRTVRLWERGMKAGALSDREQEGLSSPTSCSD